MTRFGAFVAGMVFITMTECLKDGCYWTAVIGGLILALNAALLIHEWRAKRRPATIRF